MSIRRIRLFRCNVKVQPHRRKKKLPKMVLLGSDHVQLTLLNWDTKSVLALNKKTAIELANLVFCLVPKHF